MRLYKGKYVRCWHFCLISLSIATICAWWIRELSPQQRSSKERWQQLGSGDTNGLDGSILWYRFDIELQKSRRRPSIPLSRQPFTNYKQLHFIPSTITCVFRVLEELSCVASYQCSTFCQAPGPSYSIPSIHVFHASIFRVLVVSSAEIDTVWCTNFR